MFFETKITMSVCRSWADKKRAGGAASAATTSRGQGRGEEKEGPRRVIPQAAAQCNCSKTCKSGSCRCFSVGANCGQTCHVTKDGRRKKTQCANCPDPSIFQQPVAGGSKKGSSKGSKKGSSKGSSKGDKTGTEKGSEKKTGKSSQKGRSKRVLSDSDDEMLANEAGSRERKSDSGAAAEDGKGEKQARPERVKRPSAVLTDDNVWGLELDELEAADVADQQALPKNRSTADKARGDGAGESKAALSETKADDTKAPLLASSSSVDLTASAEGGDGRGGRGGGRGRGAASFHRGSGWLLPAGPARGSAASGRGNQNALFVSRARGGATAPTRANQSMSGNSDSGRSNDPIEVTCCARAFVISLVIVQTTTSRVPAVPGLGGQERDLVRGLERKANPLPADRSEQSMSVPMQDDALALVAARTSSTQNAAATANTAAGAGAVSSNSANAAQAMGQAAEMHTDNANAGQRAMDG